MAGASHREGGLGQVKPVDEMELGGWLGREWGPSHHMMTPCPQCGQQQGQGSRTQRWR